MNGITSAFTGRLGGDADVRFTREGKPFANFSVCVDVTTRDGETPPATWVRVSYFADEAHELGARLVKGTSVYVEGRLTLGSWTGADGSERHGLNVVAWTVQVMGQIGRRVPEGARRQRVAEVA